MIIGCPLGFLVIWDYGSDGFALYFIDDSQNLGTVP